MRFSIREAASLIVGLGGVFAMGLALNDLLTTGSCGNSRPYAVVRACPPGSGQVGLLLVGGFITAFIGLLLSEGGFRRPGAGQIVWGALFSGLGVTVLAKVLLGPQLPPDAELACYIIAVVFIPIGLFPPLTFNIAWTRDAQATIESVQNLGSADGLHKLRVTYSVEPSSGSPFVVTRSRDSPVGTGMPRVGDRLRVRYPRIAPKALEEVEVIQRGPRRHH